MFGRGAPSAGEVQAAQPARGNGDVAPKRPLTVSRGHCRPFGATPRPGGVNFAVFSRHAQRVDLLLFEEGRDDPVAEFPLDPATHRTGDVWHVMVHGLHAPVQYGYRAHGPLTPKVGHRFNARAVLLDPYAPSVVVGRSGRRGRLVSDEFDWGDDRPPAIPLAETVLYEAHLRGTTRHTSSGVRHPGTYLGLAEKIPYLKSLGVTAVQVMPLLEFDEHDHPHRHPATGEPLRNFWGYQPLSYFAPKASYASRPAEAVREFKEMVRAFHRAGLEVILDVVYNHTGEGGEQGPALSFRGLDNAVYYMLDREGRYYNYSGCGNTLNCHHPVVREMVLDSLAHLVSEFHVDGFRFDLASVLGRGPGGKVLDEPTLIQHIAEHPVLSHTKLIAEAWDAAGLSQLGRFPTWGRWTELNGWFRDDVRRFVRSDPGATAALAKRLCGSADLYGETARHAFPSVNFVTCHDGFTLADLVSYNHKHNEANGEKNQDGWNDNISWNCGHEGPTHDHLINSLRQRQVRNFLTLLFVSQGVPLLLAGDEFGRTQHGNNNAYCQDNETGWVDWSLAEKNAGLLRFTRLMIALRKQHFALTREQFVGRVTWHGTKPGEPDWTGQKRILALQLRGAAGQPDFCLLFNAHWEWQKFALPPAGGQRRWCRLVDTNLPSPDDIVEVRDAVPLCPADEYHAAPRSSVILVAPA